MAEEDVVGAEFVAALKGVDGCEDVFDVLGVNGAAKFVGGCLGGVLGVGGVWREAVVYRGVAGDMVCWRERGFGLLEVEV